MKYNVDTKSLFCRPVFKMSLTHISYANQDFQCARGLQNRSEKDGNLHPDYVSF